MSPVRPFSRLAGLLGSLNRFNFMARRGDSPLLDLSGRRSPTTLVVYKLPVEVIQEIYQYLSPVDFNAARHTCNKWMNASLDKALLILMMRDGGWWEGMDEKLHQIGQHSIYEDYITAEESLMSNALATECALSSHWTGNGLPSMKTSSLVTAHHDGSTDSSLQNKRPSPFELVLEGDFSNFSDANPPNELVPALLRAQRSDQGKVRITASVCGRFALFIQGRNIFLYRLYQSPRKLGVQQSNSRAQLAESSEASRPRMLTRYTASIFPSTIVDCPSSVLLVGMDTSLGQYTVAALLEDRMGLVCYLRPPDDDQDSPEDVIYHFGSAHWERSPTIHPIRASPPRDVSPPIQIFFGDDSPALNPMFPSTKSNPVLARSRWSTPRPYKIGRKHIYQRLCSPDETPLSVAICPYQDCVAFGFQAAVDLYWVKQLGQRDTFQSFPMTVPSDFLYFLSPLGGQYWQRETMFMSSAGTVGMKGSLNMKYGDLLGEENGARQAADSWRAVPLSDGLHVLFTDPRPKTRLLCLGTNSAAVRSGILSMHVLLFDPQQRLPHVYSVGRDLTWGARIVVGYGDEVWLFSIPGDILNCHGSGAGEAWTDHYVHRRSKIDDDNKDLVSMANQSRWASIPSDSIWPVVIRGSYISTVPGLAELAIDSRLQSFTIWAFSSNGTVKAYQLRGRIPRDARKVSAKDLDNSVQGQEDGGEMAESRAAGEFSDDEDGLSLGPISG